MLVADASIVAVRGWELACVAAWLGGFALVRRYGASKYLLGLFCGSSLLAMWDWITNDVWLWNITADERFFDLFTVAGRTEVVWAPFSYGFFYAIPTVLALRHRAVLDRTVGRWQYVLVPAALGFSDILIEGISVGWLGLYDFAYRESYEWWGVPWTNIVFIAVSQVPIMVLARRVADLCELAGLPTVGDARSRAAVPASGDAASGDAASGDAAAAGPPAGAGAGATATIVAPAPAGVSSRTREWLPFWATLMICPTGLYVAAWFSALLLERLDPFLH
jgi:hypothetical protein